MKNFNQIGYKRFFYFNYEESIICILNSELLWNYN